MRRLLVALGGSRSPSSFILICSDLRLICSRFAARVTFPPVSSSARVMSSVSSSACACRTISFIDAPLGAAIAPSGPIAAMGTGGCGAALAERVGQRARLDERAVREQHRRAP